MPIYTLPYTGVLDVPANTMLGNNTGSAAAAIGMTQAQTLTFLGDPGGAFGADAATQITPSTAIVLDEATGNEIGLDLSYTVNKATSGTDTGLLLNKTDTASPGTSLLMDLQVGGTSVASVDETGNLIATSIDNPTGGLDIGGENWVSTNGCIRSYAITGTAYRSRAHVPFTPYVDKVAIATLGEASYRWVTIYGADGDFDGTVAAGLLTATAPAATDVPLSITGAAAQSANLFEIGANGGAAGDVVKVDSAGDATFSGELTLSSPTVPASAAATGVAGTISWAAGYIYICTATDTWKRVAIATW